MSRIDPGFGLVLFDARISADTLAPKGAGAAESAYTETGPTPGHPVLDEPTSTWRPRVSGAQSVAIETRAIVGGYPARDGAQLLYRLETDSVGNDWRGWNEPNLLVDWSAPTDGWGGSKVFDFADGCVRTKTGVLYITGANNPIGPEGLTWSYDPRTGTWTTLVDWDATGTRLLTPIGMAYDTELDRLILWSGGGSLAGAVNQVAYSSDDGGATWDVYARGFLSSAVTDSSGRYIVVPAVDGDWLMIWSDAGGGSGAGWQFASSDRGQSWDLIAELDVADNIGHSATRGPNGFVIVSRGVVSARTEVQLISSARADINNAIRIELDDLNNYSTQSQRVTCDDDGTLYVYAQALGQPRSISTWRSQDGGILWTPYVSEASNCGDATHYPTMHVALSSGGQCFLVVDSVGDTTTDNTVGLMTFGGWDQVSMGAGLLAEARVATRRYGVGGPSYAAPISPSPAGCWYGLGDPANCSWTLAVGTGTLSMTAEPGAKLTTTAGQGHVYSSLSATSSTFAAVEFKVKTLAGSANVATLGPAALGVGITIDLSDGAYWYRTVIAVGTDGLELYDVFSLAASATVDTTTAAGVSIRVHVTKGTATAWYRVGIGTAWIRWANAVTITNSGVGGGATDSIRWGNEVGVAGISVWRLVGWAKGGDWRYGVTATTDFDLTPATTVLGHQFGHTVPGAGAAYPIPDLTATTEELGRVSASGGPAHYGQLVDLPVGYTHPIGSIYPATSPSPRREWLAPGSAPALQLVWDQGVNQATWWGGAVALVALRAYPAAWVLQSSTDGAAWTTIGTLDLTLGTSLDWTRAGRTIAPTAAGPTIATYIREGQLVDGYMDLDGDLRRVVANSAGYWTDDSSVQRVRITLADIDGTEAASGTAGILTAPSGVLIAYPAADVVSRYLRVTAATGVQRAGILGIGRVVGVGSDPAWTWTSAQRLARRTTEASDGVSTTTQLGPPRRAVTYSWPDGSLLGRLRLLASLPDSISASGGASIGTSEDAAVTLAEHIEHSLQSGSMPCVLVPRLPTATGTLLDPSLFVYGRLSGEVSVSGKVGTEGIGEILIAGPLSITEIR